MPLPPQWGHWRGAATSEEPTPCSATSVALRLGVKLERMGWISSGFDLDTVAGKGHPNPKTFLKFELGGKKSGQLGAHSNQS
jgi:hypothetical protein